MYPLQNTYIRKVKVLRSPKFDVTKLMEVHGDYSEEVRTLERCFSFPLHTGLTAPAASICCRWLLRVAT